MTHQFRRSDDVLRGDKPADLPVQAPTKYDPDRPHFPEATTTVGTGASCWNRDQLGLALGISRRACLPACSRRSTQTAFWLWGQALGHSAPERPWQIQTKRTRPGWWLCHPTSNPTSPIAPTATALARACFAVFYALECSWPGWR